MLEKGDIDALYSAIAPEPYLRGSRKVKTLFENYVEVEKEYSRKTKIFPIMHLVVIRRELYERHPWIAINLYK